MNKTIISWATRTLNIVHGCSKPAAAPQATFDLDPKLFRSLYPNGIDKKWRMPGTSPECIRCYAEFLSFTRRHWTPKPWLEEDEAENVQLHPERFREIAKLPVKLVTLPPSQRERIFICSMGDLFHRNVPDSLLHELFENMAATPHIYQLLTKRPERAAEWPGPWSKNIWLGTTCGHEITKWRIEYLRRSKAKVRFVSMEPLLTPMLPLNLDGIHQVIVGGESGSGFRKMSMEWARQVRDTCVAQKCAFFYKQDSAFRTEQRCYIVESDNSCYQWRQFPGELSSPVKVEPDNPKTHGELFPILAS